MDVRVVPAVKAAQYIVPGYTVAGDKVASSVMYVAVTLGTIFVKAEALSYSVGEDVRAGRNNYDSQQMLKI